MRVQLALVWHPSSQHSTVLRRLRPHGIVLHRWVRHGQAIEVTTTSESAPVHSSHVGPTVQCACVTCHSSQLVRRAIVWMDTVLLPACASPDGQDLFLELVRVRLVCEDIMDHVVPLVYAGSRWALSQGSGGKRRDKSEQQAHEALARGRVPKLQVWGLQRTFSVHAE